jgi:short subunit dehydrogenase-like uncharacterized protein
MSEPRFDLVLFGATGFVGRILCRYFLEAGITDPGIAWAIAARSQQRLDALKADLGPAAASLETLVANADDESALRSLCEKTRLVVSTVGPYDLYGDTLVKVCAETGTDYCDITGEVRWMRRMIDAHEPSARRTGARIVHACGFDCVPSDLGVSFLQQQALRIHGEHCPVVRMRLLAASGAFSGGTLATMLNEARAVAANRRLLLVLGNPYCLCPHGYENATGQHRVAGVEYDDTLGKWIAPNIMASVDEPVVFRSHALLDHPYGEDFQYNEGMAMGRGASGRIKAGALTGAGKLFLAAATQAPLRAFLRRFILPAPGEGPDEDSQRRGFYVIRFYGHTAGGQRVAVQVTGDRDPGYGSTARILGECALSLATDIAKADKPGGFWTPATVYDDRLIKRLGKRAGVTFEVLND